MADFAVKLYCSCLTENKNRTVDLGTLSAAPQKKLLQLDNKNVSFRVHPCFGRTPSGPIFFVNVSGRFPGLWGGGGASQEDDESTTHLVRTLRQWQYAIMHGCNSELRLKSNILTGRCENEWRDGEDRKEMETTSPPQIRF